MWTVCHCESLLDVDLADAVNKRRAKTHGTHDYRARSIWYSEAKTQTYTGITHVVYALTNVFAELAPNLFWRNLFAQFLWECGSNSASQNLKYQIENIDHETYDYIKCLSCLRLSTIFISLTVLISNCCCCFFIATKFFC